MTIRGAKARRRRIGEIAVLRLLQVDGEQLRLAVGSELGDPVQALREGNGLPESALRQPASSFRTAFAAVFGDRLGPSGIEHVRRRGDLEIHLSARIPLVLGADPDAIDEMALLAWDRSVARDLDARLPNIVDVVARTWNAFTSGDPEGKLKASWPPTGDALRAEAARLAEAARRVREKERRLDAIGFSDLRMLHRAEPLPPRRIVALLGPTNSGKTHEGLSMLAEAGTGAYLAPLRLLAMENHEALTARGLTCDLVTGEEIVSTPGATHVSSTIEMLDIGRRFDVVLIDEIQMLADLTRGWAWTRALLSADAPVVVVAGSEDALPLIRRIARITGDEVEVRRFERRNALRVLDARVDVEDLREGDAVIAFSRADVLAWKEMLDEQGLTSAVIYGALGPDVRRSEAARFRSGEAAVMIATDAIGMGLNLPIRRVLFTTSTKFDGQARRRIRPSALRQIAGRAGRYGMHDEGSVGAMRECDGPRDWLARGMETIASLPDKVRIAPTWDGVRRLLEDAPDQTLLEVLDRIKDAVGDHPLLEYWIDEDDRTLIGIAHKAGLDVPDQFRHLGLPLSMGSTDNRQLVATWMSAATRGVTPHVPEHPPRTGDGDVGSIGLQRLEATAAQCGAYAWLARRFPDVYTQGAQALARRDEASTRLSALLARGGIARQCRSCGRRMPVRDRRHACGRCLQGR
jgi:ATP-dependent RNA helicase SUPV3L1/SUV3